MKYNVTAILTVSVILLSSCTWVKVTPLGEGVRVKDFVDGGNCKSIGTTTSYVKDNIGPMDRNQEKVTKELTILAKNRAAEMGGNTIVAEGPVEDGSMRFQVYDCH